MLKVTLERGPDWTTLRIEGRLTAPWIGELERASAPAARGSSRLRLDLAGLAYVDEAGAAALERILDEGVPVRGASPFVRALLARSEGPDAMRPGSLDVGGRRAGPPLRNGGLVARLVVADPTALEEAVRAYGGVMLHSARRLLADQAAAVRAVQAAFHTAFDSIGTFSGSETLAEWLRDLTLRAAIAELRAAEHAIDEGAALESLLPRFTGERARVRDEADDVLGQEGPGAHLEGLTPELRAEVGAAADSLPGFHRALFFLCDVEGFGLEEAARLLGLDLAAARAELHRARQALRLLLGRALARGNPVRKRASA